MKKLSLSCFLSVFLSFLIVACVNSFPVANADDCDFQSRIDQAHGKFCCKDSGRIARHCEKQPGEVCTLKYGNDSYPGTMQTCAYILPVKKEPESKEPLNQISRFHEILMELRTKPDQIIAEAFEDTSRFLTPKFDAQQVSELYNGALSKIKNGQDAQVSRAVSKVDRPDVGLVQGQIIAVRGARIKTKQEFHSNSITLMNFARLSVLRDPDQSITEFFPAFYGSYQASGSSGPYHGDQLLNFQEMELADSDYEGAFSKRDTQVPVPDSFVFEFCLGEWAGGYFAKVGSSDAKDVNFGVKRNIPYSRTYKIEGKEFIISGELMPKRLDVGGAGMSSDYVYKRMKQSFSCSIPTANYKLSSVAREFLSKLGDSKSVNFLDAFEFFYQTSEELKRDARVKDENRVFTWPAIR